MKRGYTFHEEGVLFMKRGCTVTKRVLFTKRGYTFHEEGV